MCMWQSAALAGALTLAGSVPVVFGTACWARPAVASNVPVTAAAAATVKKVRRPMAWSVMDFPHVILWPGPASVLQRIAAIEAAEPTKIGRLAPVQPQTDPLCRLSVPLPTLPPHAGEGRVGRGSGAGLKS